MHTCQVGLNVPPAGMRAVTHKQKEKNRTVKKFADKKIVHLLIGK